MFKILKKLLFIEEEEEQVVLNVEEEKKVEVVSENFEQTIALTSLDKVEQSVEEEEKPMTTFTIDKKYVSAYERAKQNPQPTYEFETIISPISGRTTKKAEPKYGRPVEKKKETLVYSHVISPMYGQQHANNQLEKKLAEEGEEISLDEFLNSDEHRDVELVQFSLFEGEKD